MQPASSVGSVAVAERPDSEAIRVLQLEICRGKRQLKDGPKEISLHSIKLTKPAMRCGDCLSGCIVVVEVVYHRLGYDGIAVSLEARD